METQPAEASSQARTQPAWLVLVTPQNWPSRLGLPGRPLVPSLHSFGEQPKNDKIYKMGIAAPRAGRPAGDADEPGVLRAPDRRSTSLPEK